MAARAALRREPVLVVRLMAAVQYGAKRREVLRLGFKQASMFLCLMRDDAPAMARSSQRSSPRKHLEPTEPNHVSKHNRRRPGLSTPLLLMPYRKRP